MLTVRMLAISLELFGGRSSSRTYRLRHHMNLSRFNLAVKRLHERINGTFS